MKILLALHSVTETKKLQNKLSEFGWTIDNVEDRQMILFHLKTAIYDLLVFSPNPDSAQAELNVLRAEFPSTPILVCADSPLTNCETAHFQFTDLVRKPYSFKELVSRILMLVHEHECATGTLQCKNMALNVVTKQVTIHGRTLRLPRKEYQLLELLVRFKNQVVTRAQILDHLWERDTDPLTNSVDVHISRLRKRLARKRGPNLIETAYGFGYIVRE